jgi:hypothetical protein
MGSATRTSLMGCSANPCHLPDIWKSHQYWKVTASKEQARLSPLNGVLGNLSLSSLAMFAFYTFELKSLTMLIQDPLNLFVQT